MIARHCVLGIVALLATSVPLQRATAGTGRIADGKVDLTVQFTYREAAPDSWRPLFEEASRLLFNATDGQLQLGQIRVVDSGLDKWDADVWVLDGNSGAFANVLGLGGSGHIYLSQTHKSVIEPAVGHFGLVHEFGHYGFGLYDEYKAAQPPGAARIAEQVLRNQEHQFCTAEGDTVACVMDGGTTIQPNNGRTEFCSAVLEGLTTRHNEGIIVDGQLFANAQQSLNGESCWETIHRAVGLAEPQSVQTADPPGLEPIDWQVVPPVDRLVICLDRSESMFVRPDRIDLAKRTAESIVGLLHERKTMDIDGAPVSFAGENLSVVSFGYDDSVLFEFREITSAATKDSANAVIDAVGQSPEPSPLSTDIGGALRVALAQIVAEGEVPAVSEAILLLSDGAQNAGTDPRDVVDALRARGVRVYAVGTGAEADEDLLREVAEATGGRYFEAATQEEVAGVAEAVTADLRAVGTLTTLEGQLLGQGEHFPMPIDSFAEEVTFALQWDSGSCDMVLTSPSGDVIDVNSADHRDDVEASLNWNLLTLRVTHPEAGLWDVSVMPQTPDSIHFGLDVFDDNRTVAIHVKAEPENVPYPQPVTLRVDVVAEVPVAGVDVTAIVDRPAGSPAHITLYDDGLAGHADAFANDGVYGAFFSDYTVDGIYTFHVRAVNSNGTGPDPDLPFVEDGPGPPPSVPPFDREASVSVTVGGIAPPVPGTVHLHPRTLNRRSGNGQATAFIELAAPHSVEEIDRSTIRLQQTVAPLPEPMTIGDQDSNGVADLTVKFDRSALLDVLADGVAVYLHLSGRLVSGEAFGASDTISVIDPGEDDLAHLQSPIVHTGDSERIEWSPVPGSPVTYSGFLSRDGGLSWEPIFSQLEGTSADWIVSGPPTTTAILLIEAWSPEGVMGQEQSAIFEIRLGAASAGGTTASTAFLGATPNPMTAGVTLRYSLAHPADVDLRVYDVQGRMIRGLFTGPVGAGEHSVVWAGARADGRTVASGIYLYVFRAGGIESRGRIMVVR
jgi:hypothetical protein